MPHFSFATSQFSALYLSGGSRQVATAVQVSATCKATKPKCKPMEQALILNKQNNEMKWNKIK